MAKDEIARVAPSEWWVLLISSAIQLAVNGRQYRRWVGEMVALLDQSCQDRQHTLADKRQLIMVELDAEIGLVYRQLAMLSAIDDQARAEQCRNRLRRLQEQMADFLLPQVMPDISGFDKVMVRATELLTQHGRSSSADSTGSRSDS